MLVKYHLYHFVFAAQLIALAACFSGARRKSRSKGLLETFSWQVAKITRFHDTGYLLVTQHWQCQCLAPLSVFCWKPSNLKKKINLTFLSENRVINQVGCGLDPQLELLELSVGKILLPVCNDSKGKSYNSQPISVWLTIALPHVEPQTLPAISSDHRSISATVVAQCNLLELLEPVWSNSPDTSVCTSKNSFPSKISFSPAVQTVQFTVLTVFIHTRMDCSALHTQHVANKVATKRPIEDVGCLTRQLRASLLKDAETVYKAIFRFSSFSFLHARKR